MAPIQMFLGGLVLGPLFAAQAGLAWYLVLGVIRFFGHWISAVLPPLRWGIWPFLRTGYVLLLAILAFGYANGSGPGGRAEGLAALLGVAASFAVALFLRHRGWRWLADRRLPAAAPPPLAAPPPAPPPAWRPPPPPFSPPPWRPPPP